MPKVTKEKSEELAIELTPLGPQVSAPDLCATHPSLPQHCTLAATLHHFANTTPRIIEHPTLHPLAPSHQSSHLPFSPPSQKVKVAFCSQQKNRIINANKLKCPTPCHHSLPPVSTNTFLDSTCYQNTEISLQFQMSNSVIPSVKKGNQ